MDFSGAETSPQRFSQNVDLNWVKIRMVKRQCIDLYLDKKNVEIDSQYLIPDELLRSINLDYIHSEKLVQHDCRIGDEKMDETNLSDSQFKILDEMLLCLNAYRRESITAHPSTNREEELIDEHLNDKNSESVVEDHCQINKENVGISSKLQFHGDVDLGTEEQITTPPDEQRDEPTPIQKLRIRRPSKFKESPYTSKFGSAAGSSARHIHIFPQKHPFVYHPIDGIVDTKIVKKFMDWISVDLLKGHAKRKKNVDHYKKGKSAIPMMHFGVETVEHKN
ncbi:hypothetical protein BC332_18288 [Capsicum chinense]|nr:hypothetical protein BC332_18288 [Capsicum chinense]